jgi:glutamate 5-kinase
MRGRRWNERHALQLMTARKVGSPRPMVIVNGKKNGVLPALFEGRTSHVVPAPSRNWKVGKLDRLVRSAPAAGSWWITGAGRPHAEEQEPSPGGVVKVEGNFKIGDCVACAGLDGSVFARGLSKYSSDDLDRIRDSRYVADSLRAWTQGLRRVIHRDDLVIL